MGKHKFEKKWFLSTETLKLIFKTSGSKNLEKLVLLEVKMSLCSCYEKYPNAFKKETGSPVTTPIRKIPPDW